MSASAHIRTMDEFLAQGKICAEEAVKADMSGETAEAAVLYDSAIALISISLENYGNNQPKVARQLDIKVQKFRARAAELRAMSRTNDSARRAKVRANIEEITAAVIEPQHDNKKVYTVADLKALRTVEDGDAVRESKGSDIEDENQKLRRLVRLQEQIVKESKTEMARLKAIIEGQNATIKEMSKYRVLRNAEPLESADTAKTKPKKVTTPPRGRNRNRSRSKSPKSPKPNKALQRDQQFRSIAGEYLGTDFINEMPKLFLSEATKKRRERLSQSPTRKSRSPRRHEYPVEHPRSWEVTGKGADIPEIFDAEAAEDAAASLSRINRSMSPKPTAFSAGRDRDREEKRTYERRLSRSPDPSAGRYRVCAACNDTENLPSPPGGNASLVEPRMYPQEAMTFRQPYSPDARFRLPSSSHTASRGTLSQTGAELSSSSPGVLEANAILMKITALLDRKSGRSYDTEAEMTSRDPLVAEIDEILEKPSKPLRSALRVSPGSILKEKRLEGPTKPRQEKDKLVSWMAAGSMESAKAYNDRHHSVLASENRFESVDYTKYHSTIEEKPEAAKTTVIQARNTWTGSSKSKLWNKKSAVATSSLSSSMTLSPPRSRPHSHNPSTGLFDDESHPNPRGYDSPHSTFSCNGGADEAHCSDDGGENISDSDSVSDRNSFGITKVQDSVNEARNVWKAVTSGWMSTTGSTESAEEREAKDDLNMSLM